MENTWEYNVHLKKQYKIQVKSAKLMHLKSLMPIN